MNRSNSDSFSSRKKLKQTINLQNSKKRRIAQLQVGKSLRTIVQTRLPPTFRSLNTSSVVASSSKNNASEVVLVDNNNN